MQLSRISDYANKHGFLILRYYTDEGRSGLTLKHRPALKALLHLVETGAADFSAILVHDVSRWGRFQEIDEGAYYEQMCYRAGIKVHYCAEPFRNDGSASSSLIKSIKRVAASEFSRDISVRASAAHIKLSKLGFLQGGTPGYGLRRAAVATNRDIIQTFEAGSRKSRNYRTCLVWGPSEEIDVVRRIYALFVDERRSLSAIVRKLNEDGITHDALGGPWKIFTVKNVLTNERYIGNYFYNRSTEKLQTKRLQTPRSSWVCVEDALPAIIDRALYESAQRLLRARTIEQPNGLLLLKLRALLRRKGTLTQGLINSEPGLPTAGTYSRRFGSLTEAYRLIGFRPARRRYD